MWYVLKIDFVSPESPDRQTKMTAYNALDQAQQIFNRLELSYLFDSPVRIKGGKKIKIQDIALLESFRDHYADALAAAVSGDATLMQQTREIDLEL